MYIKAIMREIVIQVIVHAFFHILFAPLAR